MKINALMLILGLSYSLAAIADPSVTQDATDTNDAVNICGRTDAVEVVLLRATGARHCMSVPLTDLHGITTLELRSSGISALKSGDFADLPNLETLSLYDNNLITLPADVFDGLSNLERLQLFDNSLRTLPVDVFDGLSSLTILILGDNKLSTLPEHVFDGLSNLEELSLYDNSLSTLPEHVFDGLSNLEELSLYDNSLSTLPEHVFDGLSNLITLYLHGNSLTLLPADVFDGLSNLITLYLHGNSLTLLPADVFDGLSNLITLYLYDNAFQAVVGLPAGVFDDIVDTLGVIGLARSFRVDQNVRDAHFVCSRPDAEAIRLSAGASDCLLVTSAQFPADPMSEINVATLSGLSLSDGARLSPPFGAATLTYTVSVANSVTSIRVTPTATDGGATITVNGTTANSGERSGPINLSVGSANIIKVMVTAEDGTTVQTYTLNVTRAAGLTFVNICGRTDAVKAVLLHETGAKHCAAVPLTDLYGITTLELSSSGISALKSGDFADLPNLEILSLYDNNLITLPADVFDGLSSLALLVLYDNKLSTLPVDVFDGLSSLTILVLYGNNLSTLPADVFDGLSGLTVLLLGNNKLSTLPVDVFDGLSDLSWLELHGNRLSTLPADVFDGLSKLTGLIVYGNSLTLLPADVFDGLSNLERLYLYGNRLSTLPADVFDGLSNLITLYLYNNAFQAAVGLPAGVLDDIVDTLGVIGSYSSGAFRVDQNVRDAHFICSRPDAEAIRLSAGASDCLLVTSAQFPADPMSEINVATLSGLSLSDGARLSPPFGAATLTYTVSVANSVTSIRVTPTATDGGATITVNGTTANSGERSGPINLSVGSANIINVMVTAEDGTTVQTYTLNVTRAAGLTFVNICGRTDAVEAVLLRETGARHCAAVPLTDLHGMTTLELSSSGIFALKSGDFADLPNLEILSLSENSLSTLPADVFDGLSSLTLLVLSDNKLSTLPADVFDGLSSLTLLVLGDNKLSTLPADVFDGLSGLSWLELHGNRLSTLPADVFDGLSKLTGLIVYGNRLTMLPADVFDGLSNLERLYLYGNSLSTLPADMFDGLSNLITLYLYNNAFQAAVGLPAGVFDDIVDTLGVIGSYSSGAFRVDQNVRDAHFICSRPDAAAITTSAGASDCLRVTAAQFLATLPIVISGTDAGTVTEDGTLTATGTLTLTHSDPDGSTDFRPQTDTAGTYGAFSITTGGTWTYTLDNTDPDTNALAAGETPTVTFTVAAAANPAAVRDVTLTVTGANDAPTADAGPDQRPVSSTRVTLDGSGSSDPDTGADPANADSVERYTWTQTGGSTVTLDTADPARPTFTAPNSTGDLAFSLVVNDGSVDSEADSVTITVPRPVGATDLNRDGEIQARDVQILYYFMRPVPVPNPAVLLQALGGGLSSDQLHQSATAWMEQNRDTGDVNGDGSLDQQDAQILYYTDRFGPLMRASPALRRALLGDGSEALKRLNKAADLLSDR